MGAQVAVPVAAGVVLASALILIGLGRWLARRDTSRQRLTRFAPGRGALARRRSPPTDARLVRLARAHPRSTACGVLLIVALVAELFAGAGEVGLVASVALALLGLWEIRQEGARRRARLEQQLGPAVRSMTAAISSGYSVHQAIERLANDSAPPIRDEFARVIRRTALGDSLEEALGDLAARAGGGDFEFFATLVGIQYRQGGDLGKLLLGLASSMQARMEFRAQVRALTAQARYSGRVLIALPILAIVLVYVFNRPYLTPMLETSAGQVQLAVAAVLLMLGAASIHVLSEVQP